MLLNAKSAGAGLAVFLAVGVAAPAAASQRAATGGPSATTGGGASTRGMHDEPIHDPGLNLDAYYVAIPAGWHLQGAVVYGRCAPQPFPVFRASSPDGLTVLERLPRMDWRRSNLSFQPKGVCLPLTQDFGASEYLKYAATMLGVEYVAEVPVPEAMVQDQKRGVEAFNNEGRQYAARTNTEPITQRGEVAQARARYKNGSFAMEALLNVWLVCTHSPMRVQGRSFITDTCTATLRVVRAPEGKLDAAVQNLEAAGARPNPQWNQAYTDMLTRMAQQSTAQMNQLNQQLAVQNQQFNQRMKIQNDQFNQSQAIQQRQHEQFLSTLQRGTDMSMQRAAQSANANHRAASDMVDYSLGQQTVRDPGTGQVSKVSGGFTQTWVNDTGTQSFQTSDPNANPNGHLNGSWTLQQQVHGDGTSK
jgi:hypothetical protein